MAGPPPSAQPARDIALQVSGLRRSFGETAAVDDVSFACGRGEVVALIGENGAGKSTLVKILSGVLEPSSGAVVIAGQRQRLSSPSAAAAAGVSTVFQELSLLKGFSATENLVIGREPTRRWGVISRRAAVARAEHIFAEWDVTDLRPGALVGSLSLAQQQRLEIVRALSRRPKVLLLDEPTSALGATEVDWLAMQIEKVTAAGTLVVFISHRLGEVKQISSRLLILRNGRLVADHVVGEVSDAVIFEEMIGHTLAESLDAPTRAAVADKPKLRLSGVSLAAGTAPFDLDVRPGEIVGVAGLEGQGQKRLFDVIFGLHSPVTGSIAVDDRPLRPGSVRHAVARGIGLVPENRKEGLFLELPLRDNAAISSLRRWTRLGVLRARRESEAIAGILRQLHVPAGRMYREVGTLSGGNQQKIVFAKWVLRGSKVLLLFDPTRGVDVGAKAEIFEFMRKHVQDGGSALFFSSELEELVKIPNRVVVMYRSSVAAVFSGEQITKTAVLTAMLGIEAEA